MGTVTFRTLRPSQAQVEVDTPSVAVRPLRPGAYRVTVHEDGTSEITVRSGEAEIDSQRGGERLQAGQTMEARGPASDAEFQVVQAIPIDAFDRWNDDRDRFILSLAKLSAREPRHWRRRGSGSERPVGATIRITVRCGSPPTSARIGRRIKMAAGFGKTTMAGPGSAPIPGAGRRITMAVGSWARAVGPGIPDRSWPIRSGRPAYVGFFGFGGGLGNWRRIWIWRSGLGGAGAV